jgi:hypothetical protein
MTGPYHGSGKIVAGFEARLGLDSRPAHMAFVAD